MFKDTDLEHVEEGNEGAEFDRWDPPEVKATQTPWNELNKGGKIRRVIWIVLRIILLIGFLYLFICSLDFLSSAFRLVAGKPELYTNPVCGVMIGVLSTILLQSSTNSTAIIISMVGAEYLDVKHTIPVTMGTNVGTTVTNTIVAFFHMTNKDNFRRALSGATVHDMFNWLTIVVLLPVEAATGYLFHLSKAIVDKIQVGNEDDDDVEHLEVITRPFTSKVIQVDTRSIHIIALRGSAYNVDTLQKLCCGRIRFIYNRDTPSNSTEPYCDQECSYLLFDTGMNDYALGVVLLILSLAILCICSVSIAKILHSLLYGNIKKWIHIVVNGEFPGKAKYLTGYLALLFGIGLTMLVESSSIFTSCVTPLAGAGMIKIDRVYPLTLGSNIGTTITMLMTTLTRYGNLHNFRNVLQIAFYHFFFNISGFLIFYPIPFMRWPLGFAKFLGERAAKYRWFAFVYLYIVFLVLPFSVFYLSVAGWYVLVAIYTPILVIVMIIIIFKVIQNKKPGILPRKLQNWQFLPEPLRSLDPYERIFCRPFNGCCRERCHCCKKYEEGENTNKYVVKTNDETLKTN